MRVVGVQLEATNEKLMSDLIVAIPHQVLCAVKHFVHLRVNESLFSTLVLVLAALCTAYCSPIVCLRAAADATTATTTAAAAARWVILTHPTRFSLFLLSLVRTYVISHHAHGMKARDTKSAAGLPRSSLE